MHTSGGRVSIVINGIAYSARGEIKLNPARVSTDIGVNQDGTLFKTVKPTAAMAECTFDRFVDGQDRALIWDDSLMLQNNLSATFVEKDTGITHLLTKGSFVGEPSLNLANGETDGLKFAAESYSSLNG